MDSIIWLNMFCIVQTTDSSQFFYMAKQKLGDLYGLYFQ